MKNKLILFFITLNTLSYSSDDGLSIRIGVKLIFESGHFDSGSQIKTEYSKGFDDFNGYNSVPVYLTGKYRILF